MTNRSQSPRMLPIDSLVDHKQNVRDTLTDIEELAASIKAQGLMQPVVVTQHPTRPGKYVILAGHRRTAALRTLLHTQVPCLIRHEAGDAGKHIELMLVENMQRQNLSAVEKARAMQKLIDRGMTQTDVARAIGIAPSQVNTYVMLLDLSDDELEQIEAGEVTLTHARSVVKHARSTARDVHGTPARGRPVQVEPAYFTDSHRLAATVRAACDHTARPQVGGVGCGQCWELAIRDDSLGQAREGVSL